VYAACLVLLEEQDVTSTDPFSWWEPFNIFCHTDRIQNQSKSRGGYLSVWYTKQETTEINI